MFPRSVLVFLPLFVVAVVATGCSSSNSGGRAVNLPVPTLVGDWDFLLVGAENGFDPFGPVSNRSILEQMEVNFDALGFADIEWLDETGCKRPMTVEYSFDGVTGTVDGGWTLVTTCSDAQFQGTIFLSMTYDSVADTITGTCTISTIELDQFLFATQLIKTGTFSGVRVIRTTPPPPHPGLVGTWRLPLSSSISPPSSESDWLSSGFRAGDTFTNQPTARTITAAFDATGKVVLTFGEYQYLPFDPLDLLPTPRLEFLCTQQPLVFDYTFNGVTGTITGDWFVVNDCEGDLTDTGNLSMTILLDTFTDPDEISGSYDTTSSGADAVGDPFTQTDTGNYTAICLTCP